MISFAFFPNHNPVTSTYRNDLVVLRVALLWVGIGMPSSTGCFRDQFSLSIHAVLHEGNQDFHFLDCGNGFGICVCPEGDETVRLSVIARDLHDGDAPSFLEDRVLESGPCTLTWSKI